MEWGCRSPLAATTFGELTISGFDDESATDSIRDIRLRFQIAENSSDEIRQICHFRIVFIDSRQNYCCLFVGGDNF